jgi:hypothetical protein
VIIFTLSVSTAVLPLNSARPFLVTTQTLVEVENDETENTGNERAGNHIICHLAGVRQREPAPPAGARSLAIVKRMGWSVLPGMA